MDIISDDVVQMPNGPSTLAAQPGRMFLDLLSRGQIYLPSPLALLDGCLLQSEILLSPESLQIL
jgi:hypothetical protein